jgi:HisJ family histidinol phosphate phosphatase
MRPGGPPLFRPRFSAILAAMVRGDPFIWETHGVHVGTGADHVKHGVDDLDAAVERAVGLGFPSLTFVIHSPRLTRFRYASERATDVKFIRGDASYFSFADRIAALREKYAGRILVRCGVELEWLGTGLGREWNRAKLFQAHGVDFVVSSVHFAADGAPYDGSAAETEALLGARGGVEQLWASYFDEMIEMVDASWKSISVVGHLDLPKLYAPLPACLADLDGADDEVSRRLFTLLEMIAERSLALDVNLSGIRKGVGIYPHPEILRRASALGIPVAIGSDCHAVEELGSDYGRGLEAVREAGYRYYVSFSRGLPEKRPLEGLPAARAHPARATARGRESPAGSGSPAGSEAAFRALNLGIEILNHRFAREKRLEMPRLSFGGGFRGLARVFPESSSLGSFHALRARKDERSVTITDRMPAYRGGEIRCLFSHHADRPGTLAILFNTLASEEINVETAYLNSLQDGTATAFLTLGGRPERIREAVDFVRGTAGDRFLRIEPETRIALPPLKKAAGYLLEVDGVWLPIPISAHMIIAVHANRPGVVLVLLSALASRGVNVVDLQLGARGDRNFAALGIEGDGRDVAEVLTRLGPQYLEASQVELGSPLSPG